MQEGPTQKRSLKDHSGLLAAVIPLAGLGLASFAYVFGANNTRAFENAFGIRGVTKHNLHHMMADGSYYLFFSFALLCMIGMALWALTRRVKRRAVSLSAFFLFGLFCGLFVTGGMGTLAGILRARGVVQEVRHDCHLCRVYETDAQSAFGLLIASDEERLVILTPGERIVLLNWGDLTHISIRNAQST
jgi:hypothetical protein